MPTHAPIAESVQIRAATRDDIPTILQLIRDLAEYERDPDAAVATAQLLDDALFGVERVASAVLAEEGGAALGFALYFFNFSTWTGRRGLYLEDLFVRPEARGRGIGERLMVHLAQVAESKRCGRLELSVLNWNENAIRLYRKLGGEPMDGWTVYRFSTDAIAALAAREIRPGATST